MIIEEVELTNVGRHARRKDDTNASVVGVLGPNGEGKSTWLEVVRYCLTGTLTDSAESYMRDGGIHGKTSMRLTFRKDGKQGVITRGITKTTTTRKLEWDGNVYTSAKDVEGVLAGILNADKRAVLNCVFVPQGTMGDVLFGDTSARLKQFTRMLGCAHFDGIAKAAQNQAAKLRADTIDLEPARLELATQISAHRGRHQELGQELSGLPDVTARLEQITTTLQERASRQTAQARLEQIRQGIEDKLRTRNPGATFDTARAVMEAEQQRMQQYANTSAARLAALEYQRKLRDDAQFICDNLESYKVAAEAWNALSTAPPLPPSQQAEIQAKMQVAATIKASLDGLDEQRRKQREKRAVEQQLQQASQTLESLQAAHKAAAERMDKSFADWQVKTADPLLELTRLRVALLSNFHGGDFHECPVCNSTSGMSNLTPAAAAARLQAERDKLASLESNLAHAVQCKERDSQAYDQAHQAVVRAGRNVAALQGQLAGFTGEEPSAAAEQAMQADYQSVSSRITQLQDAERARTAEEKRRDSITANWQSTQKRLGSRLDLVRDAYLRATTVEGTRQFLAATEENIKRLEAELSEYQSASAVFQEWWRMLTEEGRQYNALHSSISTAVDSMPDQPTEVLQSRKTELEAQALRIRELIAARNEVQSMVTQCLQKSVELDNRQKAQESKLLLASQMDQVAFVFGKEGIVRVYMNAVFDQLLTCITPHLERLSAPFVVRRGEEVMTFDFKRTDEEGTWLPQNKLSGGQKIKMSVAFLLALQQVVIPDVGLLVLDEPTTHLDAASREGMRDLLEDLNDILSRTECQVLVCDHCAEILPALRKRVLMTRTV